MYGNQYGYGNRGYKKKYPKNYYAAGYWKNGIFFVTNRGRKQSVYGYFKVSKAGKKYIKPVQNGGRRW